MNEFRVCLVNMPFASLGNPSLALTQLRSVLRESLGDRVSVEIHYLNQDFAAAIGREAYELIAASFETQNCGLGDWFFRHSAFPEIADNAEEYLGRYFPHSDERSLTLKRLVMRWRERTDGLLDAWMTERGLHCAQLVGFTSMFFQNVAGLAMARAIKRRNPEIVTVMGGANCETPMGEELARHAKHLDFVFSGSALKSFPQLVGHLIDGDRDGCNAIDGVFSKTNWGTEGASRPIGEELHLDQKVELDYADFLDELEEKFPGDQISPHLMFETSRGCWWGERSHCTFCGLNGVTMAHRAMSPERALEQFKELFRYYPRCRYFEAVDNLVPKEYVAEVFPALDTPPDATVFYEVKANLGAEDLEVMAGAGVRRLQPGIESLATSTLKLMKKGTTSFHNLRFLKNCLRSGIEPVWNLLVGFPGEGEEVYAKYVEDLPLLTHLFPPTGVYPVRFDRFSPYFIEAERYGLDLHPFDFYELVYPFPPEALENLAYYFMDRNFDAEYLTAMVRWLARLREPVDLWSRRWSEKHGVAAPRLCFKCAEPTIVLDSRGSGVVEHDVGEHGAAALERLEQPGGIVALDAELGHLPGFDAQRVISALQERGLVFQEGKKFLSLIVSPATVQEEDAQGAREPELKKVGREAYRRTRSSVTGNSARNGGDDG